MEEIRHIANHSGQASMCAQKKKRNAKKTRKTPPATTGSTANPVPTQDKKAFLTLYDARDFNSARRFADTLVQRYPEDAFGWKVLGSCLHKLGEIDASRQALERSLTLERDDAQTQHLMARALYDLGHPGQALGYARKSIALEPNFAQGHMTLAEILSESDRDDEALEHAIQAQDYGHERTACLFIRSHIFMKRRRYGEALGTIQQLVEHSPDNPYARNEAGNLYRDLGRFEEAEAAFRKALALKPNLDTAFFNLLLTLHYNPAAGASTIRDAILSWERDLAGPIERFEHHPDTLAAQRQLRLGFVSPGFRNHPVGLMIQPALAQLGGNFELHFYSTNNANDDLTRRLKQSATGWHLVRHLDEQALAERIYDDGIDILFDLSGFGEGSRLRTMSQKPAPIVIKWVGGLINTMGVSAYDYLLSDRYETPEGVDDAYTEKLIRLPDDYICYLPAPDAPPVTSLPAMQNGHITLGCFNNPAKINPELLAQWAELMHALPESRLFLKSGQYDSFEYADNIRTIMAEHGITEERLILEGPSKHRELLEAYNRVDIALDTWPYSGGLTTCEAFMMGVPVVTLPGPTFAGRHSATHLINAGMPELVTYSWDEYRQRVIELASDIPNLSLIRACLRQFLMQSPVCDAKTFSGHFSNAMRAIWQRYCEGKAPKALTLKQEGEMWFADENKLIKQESLAVQRLSTALNGRTLVIVDTGHAANHGIVSGWHQRIFHKLATAGCAVRWITSAEATPRTLIEVARSSDSVLSGGNRYYDLAINASGYGCSNIFQEYRHPVIGTINDHPYANFMLERVRNASASGLYVTRGSLAKELMFLRPDISFVDDDRLEPLPPRNFLCERPHSERNIDVLVPMNLSYALNVEVLHSRILATATNFGSQYRCLVEHVIESFTSFSLSLLSVFCTTYKQLFGNEWQVSLPWSQEDKRLIQLLGEIDDIVRGYARCQALKQLATLPLKARIVVMAPEKARQLIGSLIEGGVPENWEFIGTRPYKECKELMTQSRHVLNVSPTYQDWIHERIRDAAIAGCALLTNSNLRTQELFSDGINALFYDHREMSQLYSSDPEHSEKIGFSGRHQLEKSLISDDEAIEQTIAAYADYLDRFSNPKAPPISASAPAIPSAPHMSKAERLLFGAALDRAKSYFEFGSGGSTVWAVKRGLIVQGVESDVKWIETLKSTLGDQCQLTHIDIGPTGDWGYPSSPKHSYYFKNYSQAIFNTEQAFDLILVDGRFRVACVIASVQHILAKAKDPRAPRIFIHDFWNRPAYHTVLDFLEPIESVESAVLLRLKTDINPHALESTYARYAQVAN